MVNRFGPSVAILLINRDNRKDDVALRPGARKGDERPREGGSSHTWSIYSNGFLEDEMTHLDDLASFKETSAWQDAVKRAYEHHGVMRTSDESKVCELRIRRFDCFMDGAFGAASTSTRFDLDLIGLTVSCLVERKCSR